MTNAQFQIEFTAEAEVTPAPEPTGDNATDKE